MNERKKKEERKEERKGERKGEREMILKERERGFKFGLDQL